MTSEMEPKIGYLKDGMTDEQRTRAAEVVQAAHDYLLSNGWVKGSLHTEAGACLIGAVYHGGMELCQGGETMREDMLHALLAAEVAIGENVAVYEWNDADNREEDEVFDMLGRARKLLENVIPEG